jgi:hypothetical protein
VNLTPPKRLALTHNLVFKNFDLCHDTCMQCFGSFQTIVCFGLRSYITARQAA